MKQKDSQKIQGLQDELLLKQKSEMREKNFFHASFCQNNELLNGQLHPMFQEVGSDGQIISRDETIAFLSRIKEDRPIEIKDPQVNVLDENAVYATYTAVFDPRWHSRRVSVWKKEKMPGK